MLTIKASVLAASAALSASTVLAQSGYSPLPYPGLTAYNHSCVLSTPQLSCPPQDPTMVDSCCVETYGGLVLQTQFWSTYTGGEAQGQLLPPKVANLHGLWPDFCNGSYTGYCDVSRQYDPEPSPNVSSSGIPLTAGNSSIIFSALEAAGRLDLIAYINKYWIAQNQANIDFVAHEFSKHATCYSNFQTQCYGPEYKEGDEIVDFIDTVIAAYKRYPTYDWLAEAGITPSNTTTVSLSQIEEVLTNRSGSIPYIGCSGPRYNETAAGNGTTDRGRTQISEFWYYNYATGRVQDLDLTPVNSTSPSGCATTEGALLYPERGNGTEWTA